jgi:hypothetical protein
MTAEHSNITHVITQPDKVPLSLVPSSHIESVRTEAAASRILSLTELNEAIYGEVSPAHKWSIRNVEHTDWRNSFWNMESELLRTRAGQAIAAGVPGFVEFGNFKALIFNPHLESMRTVNKSKGREELQVASVVTTREHIESLFDWDKLQGGLNKSTVMKAIDTFYERSESNPHKAFAGPFGFRGPAAAHIPDHLTSIDEATGLRTVQLIAAGYDCLSNDVIEKALKAMKNGNNGEDAPNYLAITSANPSSHKTGKDEPAHYRREGIQEEFHKYPPGFFIMGHKNEQMEANVRDQYPNHEPNSTTILDFSRAVIVDGRPSIHMARHGSLSDKHTGAVVSELGMNLIIDEKARPNLPLRQYDTPTSESIPEVAVLTPPRRTILFRLSHKV